MWRPPSIGHINNDALAGRLQEFHLRYANAGLFSSKNCLLRESITVRIDPVGQRVGDSFYGQELLFQSAFGQRE